MTPKRYPIPNSPPERILQHIKQKKESGLRLTPPLRELSLSLLKNGGIPPFVHLPDLGTLQYEHYTQI